LGESSASVRVEARPLQLEREPELELEDELELY
jgi:hypothetical protein